MQDCPVKHVALTLLDHASMESAYLASFRGIYHRDPTGVPGSGPDDTGYWLSTYDHYGRYSDGVCRAGWNAYTESRLRGLGGSSPEMGDQPALFLPSSIVLPVTPTNPVVAPPIVVPAPPVTFPISPTQLFDASLLHQQILALQQQLAQVDAHMTAIDVKFDAYEQNPPWLKKFLTNPAVLGVLSTVTAFGLCRAGGKC